MDAVIIDQGRGPEIARTRISVFDVLYYLHAGWDEKGIAVEMSLGTDQVRAARQYIENHPDEIETGFRRIQERIARGNAPEVQTKPAPPPTPGGTPGSKNGRGHPLPRTR